MEYFFFTDFMNLYFICNKGGRVGANFKLFMVKMLHEPCLLQHTQIYLHVTCIFNCFFVAFVFMVNCQI